MTLGLSKILLKNNNGGVNVQLIRIGIIDTGQASAIIVIRQPKIKMLKKCSSIWSRQCSFFFLS